MHRTALPLAGLVLLLVTGACSSGSPAAPAPPIDPPSPPTTAAPQTSGPAAQEDPTATAAGAPVVRFTNGAVSVDVTVDDSTPTARDFLSLLPLTLPLEDLSGREKVGYLPRDLDVEGSPGSDPEDGDLIYFVPWGNLGFYYDAEGIDHSDLTIHLGTYDASEEELDRLQGDAVTIERVP